MDLGHFNHFVICKLLWLSIVNKLLNFEVSSSMIKKVYLTWLLSCLLELVPFHQILYIDVQFSHCLLFVLLDVPKVFISDLPVTGAFLEAFGKGFEHLISILLVFLRQLVLQGSLSQRCLLATKEQDVCHPVFLGSVGDDEVLLQPLLVERLGSKLVLSAPVNVGKHICR